ncbi:hypothetical protein E1B28_012630 [Marasmius oreades]|uniref:Helicase C-terminal domain-containing protein n=1 Tax=Marasmius oreades TaxID=181124 RepID=A0A9P7RSL5_9AGAR|nr:uncharacterized protein E1B28_012630 [Marasmius oreades]KAG7088658.1 hypothetical protein E1B28_012630 [Marasmius oreades]
MLQTCRRCQFILISDISQQFALQYTSRRFRSGGQEQKDSQKVRHWHTSESRRAHPSPSSSKSTKVNNSSFLSTKPPRPDEVPSYLNPHDPQSIVQFFRVKAPPWAVSPHVQQRLIQFGIPEKEAQILLRAFRHFAEKREQITPEAFHRYAMVRFAKISPTDTPSEYYDMTMTSVFYAWATDTTRLPSSKYSTRETHLTSLGVSSSTLKSMTLFRQATSMPFPADRYPSARLMSRKIIMHVGPTNSGKTHNALRALAAAERGIYAGPLRLLAHEIWERLNTGKIVPLGIEESDETPHSAPSSSNLPVNRSSTLGNPKYARTCNMVTGEERRIVSEDAPLLSCTVEMMAVTAEHEVAVIDEIQMVADESRGFAWTEALLSVQAKEVHLCGEETAVPIVQELLKGTNDELVVNRYERLTPLTVEENSLDSDYSNVQKGDCIVAFSRTRIFRIKKKVEEKTGMKCAVVYGQLPPELRSRQADLFNDPDTGYDVIIGSDAIGMGLNLKIRRVVFDALEKFNGEIMRPLSISQTKQIAGRAGRFGLETEGGFVTTLQPQDLQILRETLSYPNPPLHSARFSTNSNSLEAVSRILPAHAKLDTNLIIEAHRYIGILGGGSDETAESTTISPGWIRYADTPIIGKDGTVASILDRLCDSATPAIQGETDETDEWASRGPSFADRLLLILAPIPWKVVECRLFYENLIKNFLVDYSVSVKELLEVPGEWFLDALNDVEKDMERVLVKKGKSKPVPHEVIKKLEAFHRALGLYNWLSLRQPVAFFDTEAVEELKFRVEKALQWGLSTNTLAGSKRRAHGTMTRDMEALRSEVKIKWTPQERSARRSSQKTVIRLE